jgi:DNA-binding response OmpR family regulator
MRVLIIDDNPELRDFFVMSLAEVEIEAVVAQNPDDALQKVETGGLDAIVLDSIMEDCDGFALAQRIRATRAGRSVPLVIMSSISTSLARRMAESVGCTRFLVKPFGLAMLIESLRSVA